MKIAFYAAILCFMIPYLVRRGCFSESSLATRELLNIDALRILYTLGIVCCHFFDLVNIPNYGGSGVEFFFVLSGYFLSTTFRPDKTTPEFLKKKIIAWLPLIMFGSILCGGYLSCFKDIFFLQNTGLGIKNIANEPAWFLGVLFWVSLFYFYIHKALSSQARNLTIGTIAFVSCIICAHCRDLRFDLSYIPSGMIRGLACVGAGCLLAQICTRTNEQPTKKQYLFYSAVECLVLTWIVLRIFVLFYPQEWIFCVITSLFIIYLFIQKKGIISNLFEKKKISLISRYCLAIYLTHYSVSDVAKNIAEHHSAVMDHKLLFIFGILFITSLTGIFSYHAIQKPAEKWLKEHWR
ncbi:MAG: acyltransferase [Alphaproteobacteria bacterium]|nr:acyltransferase [Alphaproteobacteria bacterium]